MVDRKTVETFLKGFKEKMQITRVFFRDDRGKNAKALTDLELRPIDREAVLQNLKVEDYSEGPLEDTLYKGSELWIFGKEIKQSEVYIKISMGYGHGGVLCISFHIAERPMNYPFK